MILVDTSVWADHIDRGDAALSDLLGSGAVLCHPFVIGEIIMGNLRARAAVLKRLMQLPSSTIAHDGEVREFIERYKLYGRGIGYIDAHLLAAVRLTDGARLWTRDRRLNAIALAMGLAMTRTDH